MKRNLSPSEARKLLSKVPSEVSFWLCTNEHLRNLDELAVTLNKVNDEVFKYHVNRDKNDFEAWIRDIISDKELAREISRIKTRETLVRKISERVEELRKLTKKAAKNPVKSKKKPARKAVRKLAKKRPVRKRR